jgi:hypothetical protein
MEKKNVELARRKRTASLMPRTAMLRRVPDYLRVEADDK